jgi:hypothetical protein
VCELSTDREDHLEDTGDQQKRVSAMRSNTQVDFACFALLATGCGLSSISISQTISSIMTVAPLLKSMTSSLSPGDEEKCDA